MVFRSGGVFRSLPIIPLTGFLASGFSCSFSLQDGTCKHNNAPIEFFAILESYGNGMVLSYLGISLNRQSFVASFFLFFK